MSSLYRKVKNVITAHDPGDEDTPKKVIDYGPPYTMANPNNHYQRNPIPRRVPDDRRKAYNIHSEDGFEDKSTALKVSHLIEEITKIISAHGDVFKTIAIDIENIKNDICKMADEMDKLKQADINLKYLIGKNRESVVNSGKDN